MTRLIRVTAGDVLTAAAEVAGMTRPALLARTRRTEVVRPRQVAIYVSRQLTSTSLPGLAKRFGYRNHTSILYTVRRVPALLASDPALALMAAAIQAKSIAIAMRRSGDGSESGPGLAMRMAA